MHFNTCACCSEIITEKHLAAGTAVREGDKMYCYGCVTSRVAAVSDSKVMRVMLAEGAGKHSVVGPILRPLRRVSQRLLAVLPAGKFRRFAHRVSERMLGTKTGYYLPMDRRVPRRQLPASSCATAVAISRARSTSQHLAYASIACVVLAVGTLMLYLGFSSKSETPAQLPAVKPVTTAVPAVYEVATSAPLVPLPLPSATQQAPVRLERPAPAPTPVARIAEPLAVQIDDSKPAIPPLLIERGNAAVSSAPSRATASEGPRLRTPVATVSAAQPTEFAAWEVENLDKNAMAKAHASLDGYAYVLETRPPDSERELRVSWKLMVPSDRSILEFMARTEDGRDVAMCVGIGNMRSAPVALTGAAWRVFSLDLSELRRQSITLVLSHIPTGKENASAFWQTPQFFATPASDALFLHLDQSAASTPVAPPAPSPAAAVVAVKRAGTLDIKVEYEKTLEGFYKTLATQGVPAAKDFLAAAKTSPALAPMRGNLERDERSLGQIDELRQAAIRGARDLKQGETFKLVTRDEKEILVGAANGTVTDVDAKGITIAQTVGRNTAMMMVKWNDLSLQTQHDLAQLAIRPEEADLNMAMVKMVILSRTTNAPLELEIRTALKKASKIPALAERVENLQRHLDYFERETAATRDFIKIEGLMKASQWREARSKIEDFQNTYMSSYALEQVGSTLEKWTAEIQKQSVSPLLKR